MIGVRNASYVVLKGGERIAQQKILVPFNFTALEKKCSSLLTPTRNSEVFTLLSSMSMPHFRTSIQAEILK